MQEWLVPSRDKVIWVMGHRKAGTTLITNLLDGHPAVSNFLVDLRILYAYSPVLDLLPSLLRSDAA